MCVCMCVCVCVCVCVRTSACVCTRPVPAAPLPSPPVQDSRGAALSSDRRRKFCDAPANVEGVTFGTDLVYTFHFWQHYADFGGYKLSLVGGGERAGRGAAVPLRKGRFLQRRTQAQTRMQTRKQ